MYSFRLWHNISFIYPCHEEQLDLSSYSRYQNSKLQRSLHIEIFPSVLYLKNHSQYVTASPLFALITILASLLDVL